MNAAAIAAALGERAESVCRRYLPHGRKHGRYWVAGDLDGARGRSLYVRLQAPARQASHAASAENMCSEARRRLLGDLFPRAGSAARRGTYDAANILPVGPAP